MDARHLLLTAVLLLTASPLYGGADMADDMGPPSAGAMMQVAMDGEPFDAPERGALAMPMDVAQTQDALEVDPPKDDKAADRTYDAAQLGAELDKKNGNTGPLASQIAQGHGGPAIGAKLVPVTKNKKRAKEVMKNILPAAKPAPEGTDCLNANPQGAEDSNDNIEEALF